jgi:sugar transferase (PEP-CTERM system associated)
VRVRVLGHYVHAAIFWLAVAELSAGLIAVGLGQWLHSGETVARSTVTNWQQAMLFAVAYIFVSLALGAYGSGQRVRLGGLLLRTLIGVIITATGILIVARAYPAFHSGDTTILVAAIVLFGLSMILRLSFLRALDEEVLKRRVLVYGSGKLASALLGLRRRADRRGFFLLGHVAAPGERSVIPAELLISANDSLLELCRRSSVDEIVVAMDDRRRNFPILDLLDARLAGIDVTDIVTFLERETGKVRLDVLNPTWMIFGQGFRRDALRAISTRVLDVSASLFVLLVTWPVMAIAALAIKTEDGFSAPALYRQVRVGQFGRHFEILKFRSMRVDAESGGAAQWAAKGDPRITKVGAIMRRMRVDELPQIFNVLNGDMSFVGPRPERPEFVERLSERIPYYRERHWVKPGITGWAQLRYPYGSSEQDAAEKLQYDLYYVKNHSFVFDLAILLQTAEVILFGKGAR